MTPRERQEEHVADLVERSLDYLDAMPSGGRTPVDVVDAISSHIAAIEYLTALIAARVSDGLAEAVTRQMIVRAQRRAAEIRAGLPDAELLRSTH